MMVLSIARNHYHETTPLVRRLYRELYDPNLPLAGYWKNRQR
jgi:hypothetical protein